jgi:homoserine kinase type II
MLDLSTVWDVPAGTFPQTMDHTGYNNALYRVHAGERELVLRVYGNHANPRNIQHELTIVYQLQGMNLPFAVPAPIPTRRNELWHMHQDGRARKLMVLLPFIPGTNPLPSDLAQAEAAGGALGHLLQAMQHINTRGLEGPKPVTELNRVHPLVPDAFSAIDTLGSLVPARTKLRINAILEAVYEDIRKLIKPLSTQLTHGDFINGNMLMEGTRVTGVLDFENSAVNPRVMDLAIAIDTWSYDAIMIGDASEWGRIDALGRGFCRVSKLSSQEIAAIPTLILLRNANVLMHLVGRFLANTTPYVDVESWMESMAKIDAWLVLNAEKLVDRAAAW